MTAIATATDFYDECQGCGRPLLSEDDAYPCDWCGAVFCIDCYGYGGFDQCRFCEDVDEGY